uniref:C2H2-type domain-containing protein n=1 Tax=viral metagenome TaxID=1070528 RepID=A0A6C0CR28_9ZZZZ
MEHVECLTCQKFFYRKRYLIRHWNSFTHLNTIRLFQRNIDVLPNTIKFKIVCYIYDIKTVYEFDRMMHCLLMQNTFKHLLHRSTPQCSFCQYDINFSFSQFMCHMNKSFICTNCLLFILTHTNFINERCLSLNQKGYISYHYQNNHRYYTIQTLLHTLKKISLFYTRTSLINDTLWINFNNLMSYSSCDEYFQDLYNYYNLIFSWIQNYYIFYYI